MSRFVRPDSDASSTESWNTTPDARLASMASVVTSNPATKT